MNVVLCGMMGCGKTTVARALERNFNLVRVDTDELIIRRHGEINKIFAERGEDYFRNLEAEAVKYVAENYGNAVISLGGGAVLRAQNVERLRGVGKIVFLRTRAQTLIDRLKGDNSRPLLRGALIDEINALLKARTPIYEACADFTIDTDGLTPDEIANKIMEHIK